MRNISPSVIELCELATAMMMDIGPRVKFRIPHDRSGTSPTAIGASIRELRRVLLELDTAIRHEDE